MTVHDNIEASGLTLFDGEPVGCGTGKSFILTDGEHFEIVEFDPTAADEETVLADMMARFRQQLN